MTHGSSWDMEIGLPEVEYVTLGLRPRVTFNLGALLSLTNRVCAKAYGHLRYKQVAYHIFLLYGSV